MMLSRLSFLVYLSHKYVFLITNSGDSYGNHSEHNPLDTHNLEKAFNINWLEWRPPI